jgi:hypothetical protein
MSSVSPTSRPPAGTAIDAAGNIYVSGTDRERVIKITPMGKVSTLIQDPRLLWVDARTPGDESDTLTKQVCAKCPAIAKTFDYAVPIGQFFGEENEERAWKILYNYRSKIAHGGSVDFSKRFTKKGFAELNDRKHVQAFLHLYVRLLLKSALRDPEAMRSLKRG